MDDELLDEQIAYYRRRAPVYDESYHRSAEWSAELAVVEAALDDAITGGDVLELGCGTGYWTARLAAVASSVVALDAAAEVVAIARDRVAAHAHVDVRVVDVLRAWHPERTYDGVVACFFIEHVPEAHLAGLLARVAAALRPGGTFFLADGAFRGAADEVETRELDGRSYRVVEHRRTPDELRSAFGTAGIELRVEVAGRRFCYAVGTRLGAG